MIRTARSVVRLAAVAAAAVAIAACEVNLNTEGLTAKEKRNIHRQRTAGPDARYLRGRD